DASWWGEVAMTSPVPAATMMARAQLYRAIYRLHFYAGLLVAPFLLALSLTGAIYLFEGEIQDASFSASRFVAAPGEHLPPGHLARSALERYPDSKVTRIDMPTAADRTAVVFMTPAAGEAFRVYVDPVSAEVR